MPSIHSITITRLDRISGRMTGTYTSGRYFSKSTCNHQWETEQRQKDRKSRRMKLKNISECDGDGGRIEKKKTRRDRRTVCFCICINIDIGLTNLGLHGVDSLAVEVGLQLQMLTGVFDWPSA